jgi:phosphatidylglycerophosphate synthase
MSPVWSADCIAAAALLGTGAVGVLAALVRPERRSERAAREGGTVFLPERIMHGGHSLAAPVIRLAVTCRVPPDAITWMSLVPGFAAGLAVACGHAGFSAWLLALSGLCDLLDGAVARAIGRTSAAGAALDSILDRYVEFFFLAGLVWFFVGSPYLQLLTMTALFGSFMVTYSTAKAEALGVAPPRGWMKRPERVVWLIASSAVAGVVPAAGWPARPVLAVGTGIIAVFANLSAGVRLIALRRSAG